MHLVCQEKKEEEDSQVLKIALIHQYNDLRKTLNRTKNDKSQKLVTAMRIWEQIKNNKTQ